MNKSIYKIRKSSRKLKSETKKDKYFKFISSEKVDFWTDISLHTPYFLQFTTFYYELANSEQDTHGPFLETWTCNKKLQL